MANLVFIIDDDPIYLKLMREHFRQMEDYLVESYAEADEALLQLKNKEPFLIILDHNLSHQWKDGLYYLKEIKKLKPSVPIFYITSDNSPSLKEKAMKAGAEKFILKDSTSLLHIRMAMDEMGKAKKPGFFSRLFK